MLLFLLLWKNSQLGICTGWVDCYYLYKVKKPEQVTADFPVPTDGFPKSLCILFWLWGSSTLKGSWEYFLYLFYQILWLCSVAKGMVAPWDLCPLFCGVAAWAEEHSFSSLRFDVPWSNVFKLNWKHFLCCSQRFSFPSSASAVAGSFRDTKLLRQEKGQEELRFVAPACRSKKSGVFDLTRHVGALLLSNSSTHIWQQIYLEVIMFFFFLSDSWLALLPSFTSFPQLFFRHLKWA